MLEKIINSIGLKIPNHVMRSKDPRALTTTVFAAWLPLSTAVLVSVIEQLPSPVDAQSKRMPDIIEQSPGSSRVDSKIRTAVTEFRTSSADPIVAYVSKMVSVPVSELPQNKRKRGGNMTAEKARELARKKRAEIARKQATESNGDAGMNGMADTISNASPDSSGAGNGANEDPEEQVGEPEELIGFARLFSGTVSVGDSVYVLPPKYSPANPSATQPQKVTVTALFMLMGRSLEALPSVPAGVVFGIGGLGGHILKSGTLCSQAEGALNLAGVPMGGEPIVRVAVEPVNPMDLDRVIEGLKLLEQSDASARYEVLENGEHVILVAGELHLERCLKDLKERFARCEVQVSEPLVPYRETILSITEMLPPKSKDLPRGTVMGVTQSKQLTVRLRVRPLPEELNDFLQNHLSDIKRLYAEKKAKEEGIPGRTEQKAEQEEDLIERMSQEEDGKGVSVTQFKSSLKEALAHVKEAKDLWLDAIEKISAFGPRRIGPNLLIDATQSDICGKL